MFRIKKKLMLLTLLFVSITTILCACSNKTETTSSNKDATIQFIDDEGREIKLDKTCEKIISLYSAHTENLYSLGAGDKIIGGYKTCIYPADASEKTKYSYKEDPEKIIAANPDLVLIRPFITKKEPDFVKTIEKAGITVVSLYPDNYDEFDEYIKKLSLLVGKEQNAKVLLEEQKQEIKNIQTKTSKIENKQKIFFESTETNLRTVTDDSMPGKAIELAGGINIAKGAKPINEGSSIAPFGIENILKNADNIDVYVSQRGAMNSGGSLLAISQRSGFDTIKAVKDKRVYVINEKIISSPTFRYVKGIKELARYLYPDVMDSYDEYKNDEIANRRSFANILVKVQHLPIWLPSSSKYYNKTYTGHTFGYFEDVNWQDKDIDYIETAVMSGKVPWDKENGKELFKPDEKITKEQLAKCIYLSGNFKNKDEHIKINDVDKIENKRIVQCLVDNGVFSLNNGNFEPKKEVTNNEIIEKLNYN